MRRSVWVALFYLLGVWLAFEILMPLAHGMDCSRPEAASWCSYQEMVAESATESRILERDLAFWSWPSKSHKPRASGLNHITFEVSGAVAKYENRKTIIETIHSLQHKIPDVFAVGYDKKVWITVQDLDNKYAVTAYHVDTGFTSIRLDPIFFNQELGTRESILLHETVHVKLFWDGFYAEASECSAAYHEMLAYRAELEYSRIVTPTEKMLGGIKKYHQWYREVYVSRCFTE